MTYEIEYAEWSWKGLSEVVPLVVGRCACTALIMGHCESPIEIIFGAAVLFTHPEIQLCDGRADRDIERPCLIPQYVWRRYRMDFALCAAGKSEPSVFVECDGREFHSTPEQLARDRLKDADAKIAGVTMFRFSGSEIHNHFDICAQLVFAELERHA